MPFIRQYDPGQLDIRPSETGVSARAAAARRIQSEFTELGQASKTLGAETAQLGELKQRRFREQAEQQVSMARARGAALEAQAQGLRAEGEAMRTEGLGLRTIGNTIEAGGQAATHWIDHQQISHGSVALAGLMNQKTLEWNDLSKNADPNDTGLAQKFLTENLEPALEQFKSGFVTNHGQAWAEAHVDAFRKHMYDKTASDMSTLAGSAVAQNYRATVNGLSNTVRSDPSSLDFSLRTLESSLGSVIATSPNLRANDASRARTELLQQGKEAIVKSAAFGHIEKTGTVPDWVTDARFSPYINGPELKQFEQAAKFYQRAAASENRAVRVEQQHEYKLDFNKTANDIEMSTMPQNVGDSPRVPNDYWQRIRQAAQHPGAEQDPSRLRDLIRHGEILSERLGKPEPRAAASHATTMDLMTRMRATDESRLTDNSEIYNAFQHGDLTNADFNFLQREFTNLRTPDGQSLEKDRGEFVKRFAQVIDGSMTTAGQHSILGTQRMYEFEMEARRQEGVLRSEGKDPHLVYDPRSQYFAGRPENIAKYHVSFQEAQEYEKTLRSMDKENAKPSTAFVPPQNWQWSPSRRQYRDPTGQIYDAAGNKVK